MKVYNLEKFAIEQMFLPYQNLITEDENEIKQIKKNIHIDPCYMWELLELEENAEAKKCVYDRLRNLNIEWYKHLRHMFISFVNWEINRPNRENKEGNTMTKACKRCGVHTAVPPHKKLSAIILCDKCQEEIDKMLFEALNKSLEGKDENYN